MKDMLASMTVGDVLEEARQELGLPGLDTEWERQQALDYAKEKYSIDDDQFCRDCGCDEWGEGYKTYWQDGWEWKDPVAVCTNCGRKE